MASPSGAESRRVGKGFDMRVVVGWIKRYAC